MSIRRKLGVNIDHVATLRQVRQATYPDPVEAALIVIGAGAQGVTVHLREDRRHIQDRDLRILREVVHGRLNLEMGATQEMLIVALETKPDCVTLVPERREELTTEGGLDLQVHHEKLEKYLHMLHEAHIEVSLFIDPNHELIRLAHRLGAKTVEINTARYCEAKNERERQEEIQKITDCAKMLQRLKIRVAAGHGINFQNIFSLLDIEEIEEFNIGHSLIARAVMVGLPQAVGEMVRILNSWKS